MKTHWRKTIDTDWIGTYVLPDGKPIVVKIIRAEYKNAKIQGKTESRVVAFFEKNQYFDKPMLLNSTNMKRLTKLVGSPYIEDWHNLNLPITLQQEMDRTPSGGKDWALRISSIKPVVKTSKDFPEEAKKLNGCKNLKELQEVYSSMSRELQAIFTDLKNELKTKLK